MSDFEYRVVNAIEGQGYTYSTGKAEARMRDLSEAVDHWTALGWDIIAINNTRTVEVDDGWTTFLKITIKKLKQKPPPKL